MAVQAAAVAKAAKIAYSLLRNEKTRKMIGVLIGIILSPLVLAIVLIFTFLSGTANHNNAAINLTFNGGQIPPNMPADFRQYIEEMRDCFTALDEAWELLREEYEWEEGDEGDEEADIDMIRVKSVFYALYFGDDSLVLRAGEARDFLECFIETEDQERWVENEDEEGEDTDGYEEQYTSARLLEDLQVIYANVGALVGRAVTPEDMANINEIYLRVTREDFSIDSITSLSEGNGTHTMIADLIAGMDEPPYTGGWASPIAGDWRSMVSCEFGTGYAGHTGMDMAMPIGTVVQAAGDGKVLFTRSSTGGYGMHVAIYHGGDMVTLYAHCSQLLVGEGLTVTKGQPIALSGNTGNSTGPHLHLEFVIGSEPHNPRNYLQ